MKKIVIIIALLLAGLPMTAQEDTTRYGDSWLMFAPKPGQMTSFRSTGLIHASKDSIKIKPNSLFIDYSHSFLDTIPTEITGNGGSAFRYIPDSDIVVYGLAYTMNANWMPTDCDSFMTRVQKVYGNYSPIICDGVEKLFLLDFGDAGFFSMLLTRAGWRPGVDTVDHVYMALKDSVHLGLLDRDADIWRLGKTNHIRRSTYIYEFDTTAWPDDTVDLFEFYFKTPHTFHANDTFYAA